MVKINDVLLFSLLIPLVYAKLNRIQDQIEKCWPSQRFSYFSYIFGQTFMDEKYDDLLALYGKNQSRFVGIHNR